MSHAYEATAPCRIDLAGGTLDIWPIYLFHPGAVTVNVAIDRRAWCRVETGHERILIESKDTLQKAEGTDVSAVLGGGILSLVAYILRALRIESGVRVVTQSRVPAGSGLGGSSALAVAIAAAAAKATGREVDKEDLWPIVRDAEAQCLGIPAGMQDHLAALHGGALAIHLEAGRVRTERLSTDPARIEECLMLVDAGATRFSGINNWDVFKGQIDGDPGVREAFAKIVVCARGVRDALIEGRYEEVAPHVAAEWEARKRLSPAVTTPEIDRIAEVAQANGGAAKVCGAGGGGMVAVWAPPGEGGPGSREAVEGALRAGGFKIIPYRLDLRGLEIDAA
jgi:D-glycero-alpha-D-manno-heptose-7-phosphate kinase